jgi:hypothetical protein
MTDRDPIYRRHRFSAEIIAHAVWLYFRFPLSLRMVEDMLAPVGPLFHIRRSDCGRRNSGEPSLKRSASAHLGGSATNGISPQPSFRSVAGNTLMTIVESWDVL